MDLLESLVLTVGGSALGYAWGSLRAWRRFRRELGNARRNEFSDYIAIKAAVVWQQDNSGPWHLSIREWLDKELAARVLANASVTQVVRDAAESEGLIRLSDPLLHRRVMDLVRYHFTGNDMEANLKFLTGRHVRRDQLLFGLISPNREDGMGDAELFRLGMPSILLIYYNRLDVICSSKFAETVMLGHSATRHDAVFIHKIGQIAQAELAKEKALAALQLADIESVDEEYEAELTAAKVFAKLKAASILPERVQQGASTI
jgi:hypothetical protein